MIGQFQDQLCWDAAIGADGVPVLLVHVVAGLNAVVPFPKFNGPFGIAFQIHACERVHVHQREDLSGNTEHEYIRAEGEVLAEARFLQAMGAEDVEGHGSSA